MMKKTITLLTFLALSTFSFGQLIFNEVLYDPSNNALDGDANGDGVYDQEDDSFIEFYNIGNVPFDASGYQIWDDTTTGSGTLRFVVPNGTLVPANGVMVVFGSGPLVGTFGGAVLLSADTTASHLNLNNSGEVIGLKDANGNLMAYFDSDALSNNPNESYTRYPDVTGPFIQHGDSTAVLFSPGTKVDGTPFNTIFFVTGISVQGAGGVSTITTNGGTLQMEAMVTPTYATDTTVTWSVPAGNSVATINASGLLSPVGNGMVYVKATANDGSGVTDSVAIAISNQSIGIAEDELLAFRVYPNPTSGKLFIDTDLPVSEISIYSVTGTLISRFEGEAREINVASLASGVYIIAIKSGNESSVRRFLKN